jgi:hypothetical protein
VQCYAHYIIGITRLSEGDRDGAHKHFAAAVATRFTNIQEYDWSRAFLARLERDPTWPPWIPVKP